MANLSEDGLVRCGSFDTAPIKGSDKFLPHIGSLVDEECVQVIGVFDSGRWSMQS